MASDGPFDEAPRRFVALDHPGGNAPRVRVETVPGLRPDVVIEQALRERRLDVWYQPKIDLRRKCLAGAEALPRIQHPARGELPQSLTLGPDEPTLMRLAEHVLLATLRDWSTFDQAGFNLRLAVNIPVSVLLKLPVAALVREHGPRAEHWPGLIVEITEDQIARDVALASEAAEMLKVNGVAVAIDDFGAGCSSFACLRRLPFAELKLDASLVRNCAVDGAGGAICQTAVDLAHRFGSLAVAEGVENAVDLQALQVMRCDLGQGMLLAPAMPKERFIALLNSRLNKPVPVVEADPDRAEVPVALA